MKDNLHDIFTSLSVNDQIQIRNARIRHIEEEIISLASTEVVFENHSSMDTYSILELAYSIPKRAADLIEAMKPCIHEDRVIPVVIMARALLETTAVGCLFCTQIEKKLEAQDYDGLAKTFVKFYAGGRIPGTTKGVHINDGLRLLEKLDLEYLKSLNDKHSMLNIEPDDSSLDNLHKTIGVMFLYDTLSEIAHPNGLGLQYLYPADDAPSNKEVKQQFRHWAGSAVWQCNHIVRQLSAFKNFDERYHRAFPNPNGFQSAIHEALNK